MKKILCFLGLLICIINAMGQVPAPGSGTVIPVGLQVSMSDGTYATYPFGPAGTSPVMKNGMLWWVPCAYYQKKLDTTGIINPNFVILTDTAKGSVYEVGGHVNIGMLTGTMAVFFRLTYTDEFGFPTVRNIAPNGTNTSALAKLGGSSFNPVEITPLRGSVMVVQLVQVPGTAGTVRCNPGAHFKVLW